MRGRLGPTLLLALVAALLPGVASPQGADGRLQGVTVHPAPIATPTGWTEVATITFWTDGLACDDAGLRLGLLVDADHDASTGSGDGLAAGLGVEADLTWTCDPGADAFSGATGTLTRVDDEHGERYELELPANALPSDDFAFAGYLDDGVSAWRFPAEGGREHASWWRTTNAEHHAVARYRDRPGDTVPAPGGALQGVVGGTIYARVNLADFLPDCTVELWWVGPADTPAATIEADLRGVQMLLEDAARRSADMRTKVADACDRSELGDRIVINVVRDDPDVDLGQARTNGDGFMAIDVGDHERYAAHLEGGTAADRRAVTDAALIESLAHEIDHLRNRPGANHRDPAGAHAFVQTGPAVDDSNMVLTQLGHTHQQDAYGTRWPDGRRGISWTRGGNRVFLPGRAFFRDLNRNSNPRAVELVERRASPGESGLPDHACGEGNCYQPAELDTGPPRQLDDDGDSHRDSVEAALGSASHDAASTPEHPLIGGSCDNGDDDDGDGFTDAADASCRPASSGPGVGADPVPDHERRDRGGVGADTDTVRLTGTLALDHDGDGQADETVDAAGWVAWQRVAGDPVTLQTVALDVIADSAQLGPLVIRDDEAAEPLPGGIFPLEDGPGFIEVNVPVVADTGEGSEPLGPLFLGGQYDAWPPRGDWEVGGGQLVVGGQLTVSGPSARVETTPAQPVRLGAGGPAAMSAAVALADAQAEPFDQVGPRGAGGVVLLSRDDDFADALAGLAVAGLDNAPMLLTPSDALAPEVADAIDGLDAARVVILGGEAAISTTVEDDLLGRGLVVERIGGATRFHTAALLAERLDGAVGLADGGLGTAPTAILAAGRDFPDAISGGAAAYAGGYPVLLTERDGLPEVTRQALADLGVELVVVAGGTVAVSDEVVAELEGAGLGVLRLFGAERTATARVLGDFFGAQLGSSWATLVVANGQDFPEALVLGAVAGRRDVPLALVQSPDVAGAAADWVDRRCGQVLGIQTAGDRARISDALLAELAAGATC